MEAMNEEIAALYKYNTRDIIPRLIDKKYSRYEVSYKINYKLDDDVKCYKVILVARGFTQQYGYDYDETFSHVLKRTTRVILYLVL